MKWSLRIGRVAGIGIYLHASFLLLPLWVGWNYFGIRQNWQDAISGVFFAFVLFGIIVLHELGHALTARRFGIETRDITLLPIGGVARLERMPEQPGQELLVALAGPAVNIALAALAFAILAGLHQLAGLLNTEWIAGGNFLVSLVWVNVALAVFNLVPAFPMDGGRVLRALLATRLNYARATRIAARIGQALAIGFVLLGLLRTQPQPILVLIGFFIYVGASQESAMVQIKSALGGATIGEMMIREFRVLSPQDTLASAAGLLLNGWQYDFPVVEQGRLVGMLNRDLLVRGLKSLGTSTLVGAAMDNQFPVAGPNEPAHAGLSRLRASGRRTLAVMEDGHLLGILAAQNIGDYLALRAAIAREFTDRPGQRSGASSVPPKLNEPIPGSSWP